VDKGTAALTYGAAVAALGLHWHVIRSSLAGVISKTCSDFDEMR